VLVVSLNNETYNSTVLLKIPVILMFEPSVELIILYVFPPKTILFTGVAIMEVFAFCVKTTGDGIRLPER
jgi:hypothetical protein